MGDPDGDSFAVESLIQRVLPLQDGVVDIAVDRPQRFDGGQTICYFQGAYIPSMPDLVRETGVFADGFIQMAMRVGEQ
jgi:hypothetical protein